jgi:hypothetical protein
LQTCFSSKGKKKTRPAEAGTDLRDWAAINHLPRYI